MPKSGRFRAHGSWYRYRALGDALDVYFRMRESYDAYIERWSKWMMPIRPTCGVSCGRTIPYGGRPRGWLNLWNGGGVTRR
jgi:hypothetical protein